MSKFELPRWHEVIAVLGGRFDPPHLGHREAVRGLFRCPGVKEVRILPSAAPPHKPAMASMEDRAAMARLNFQSTAQDPFPSEVTVDDRELKRMATLNFRPSDSPTYSYDTLLDLCRDDASSVPRFAFVIGSDQFAELPTWYRFPEVLTLCHWLVLERKPHGSELARQVVQQWVANGLLKSTQDSSIWNIPNHSQHLPTYLKIIPTVALPISSTAIREEMARNGEVQEGVLFPPVTAYLKERKLYGIQCNSGVLNELRRN